MQSCSSDLTLQQRNNKHILQRISLLAHIMEHLLGARLRAQARISFQSRLIRKTDALLYCLK